MGGLHRRPGRAAARRGDRLCGRHSNSNGSATNSSTRAAAPTVTRTVVQPKVITRTNTVTASTVTQAPPNPANEQRRVEAEANLHKLEKENEELRRQAAEGG